MDAWPIASGIVADSEGGFQNHAEDSGNWTGGVVGKGTLKGTKFGISAASYPDLDIENLTLDQALVLYRRDYYDVLRCGDMPVRFAVAAFDGAILQGPNKTAFLLQQALGTPQDGQISAGGAALAAMRQSDADPQDMALVRFLALRSVAEIDFLVDRPSMLAWADNYEMRMFKLARTVFGPDLRTGG